jgi:hypothetical protein
MATSVGQFENRRRSPARSSREGAPPRSAQSEARRLGRLVGHLLLEIFFATLPTDLSAFLGVVVQSRGTYLLAGAQVLAGALVS